MSVRSPIIYKDAFAGDLPEKRCDLLDKLIEDSKDPNYEDKRFTKTIVNIADEDVERIIKNKSTNGVSMPVGTLRPYQTAGVKYMVLSRNALLTDAVGLGKTVQVASLVNFLTSVKESKGKGKFTFIYLTKLGLVEQTRRELIKFTGKYLHTTSGKKDEVASFLEELNSDDFNGLVCSYSVTNSFDFMVGLNSWVSKHGKIDYLFIDESSLLGNRRTDTYKAFVTLRDKLTKYRVLLNATPIQKSLDTAYAQMDFTHPKALPTKGQFDNLYVKKNYMTGKVTGHKDPAGFKKATRYLMSGTTRNELGITIKNSTCQIVSYPLTDTQKKLLRTTSFPQYVFDDPTWVDSSLDFNENNVPKLKVLLRLIASLDEEQVLIYCKYKKAQDEIKEALDEFDITSEIINGDDTSVERHQKKTDFEEGQYQVLITNLKEGLNLGFVNHLVYYSFSADSSMMNQVEGRIIRTQNILYKNLYLLVANTNEYKVLEKASSVANMRKSHGNSDVSLLNTFLKQSSELIDAYEDEFKAGYLKVGLKINTGEGKIKTDMFKDIFWQVE